MKKWVIVEDRPWVMEMPIKELRKKAEECGHSFINPIVLYFIPGTEEEQKAKKEKYKHGYQSFCHNTGISPIQITKDTFEAELNKYIDTECAIFMDLNLSGDNNDYFYNRQNVQYVKKKFGKNSQNKIWFYTTGASMDSRFLFIEFPGNYISVNGFVDGNVDMDIDKAWAILQGD